MTSEPLDELQWSLPEWIQAFGLNYYNVLEYFAQSPFYDRSSNNQTLKMQYQFNPAKAHMTQTHPEFVRDLERMTGVEFIVQTNDEPHFYIVRKQERQSPQRVQILHDYYIINLRVYMAHDIFSILNSRLLNCNAMFKQSYSLLGELSAFQTETGHLYVATEATQNIRELEKKLELAGGSGEEGEEPKKKVATGTPTPGSGTPGTSASSTGKQAQLQSMSGAVMLEKLASIALKDIQNIK